VHVLRISNAFGAPVGDFGSSRRLVLHDFALQGVNAGIIEFSSPGSTCRDFVPVSYVARIIEKLVNPEAGYQEPSIINLTSGDTKTLQEAANIFGDAIRDITGVKPRILGNLTTTNSTSRFLFSNKLANRVTPYSPSEFGDEVNRLIKFIRNRSYE
jgi:nucleoside-diphosphate-sugar epimerase